MNPVIIIGMGLSLEDLTSKHLEQIKRADVLVGGKRHLEHFKDFPVIRKEIGKNIKGLIDEIKSGMESQSVVVLASGDPLFFGIGHLLIHSLGPENVHIYPNITTAACAFSRIKASWHDAAVISIHGRYYESELIEVLEQKNKIAVYTDPEKNPSWLARFMLEKDFSDFQMCVLEHLGMGSERIEWVTLSQAAAKQFFEPNLVVLLRAAAQAKPAQKLYLGMPETCYEHESGLITKAEVRAVTISKLRLSCPSYILWDLGAGSGSIAIEASLFLKHGKIYSIEQNADRIVQIKTNKNRFQTKNLEIIQAKLPDGIDNLPQPDRIFIGGGGKELETIIRAAAAYLKPEGIMVINTVLISNVESAMNALKQLGFKTEIVQIQVSRGKEMPWGERLEAQNPVWIISGEKK